MSPHDQTVRVQVTPAQIAALRAARRELHAQAQLLDCAEAAQRDAYDMRRRVADLDALLEAISDAQFAASFPETARRMRARRSSSPRQVPRIPTPPATAGGSL